VTPIQKVDVLRAACCVAGADGETDEQEMSLLLKLAADVGVGTASLDAMISRAESDVAFCEEQFRFLKDDPSECVAIMMQVASVNGVVGDQEQQVLQKLANNLGISPAIFTQLLEQTKNFVDGNQ